MTMQHLRRRGGPSRRALDSVKRWSERLNRARTEVVQRPAARRPEPTAERDSDAGR